MTNDQRVALQDFVLTSQAIKYLGTVNDGVDIADDSVMETLCFLVDEKNEALRTLMDAAGIEVSEEAE